MGLELTVEQKQKVLSVCDIVLWCRVDFDCISITDCSSYWPRECFRLFV